MTAAPAAIASTPRAEDAAPPACAHCGLPVAQVDVDPSVDEQFCCAGCRTVYRALRSCGLDRYYALRDKLGEPGQRAVVPESGFDRLDDQRFQDLYVRRLEGGLRRCELLLEGVHCAACVWLVEKLPTVVPGLLDARLDLARGVAAFTWDPGQVSLSAIGRAAARFGYRPHPVSSTAAHEARVRQDREYLMRIGGAGACAGNVMLVSLALYSGIGTGVAEPYATLFRVLAAAIGVLAVAWPGGVFLRGAVAAVRARTWHMDMPVALALVVGCVAGVANVALRSDAIYFDSITMLVFLLLVGRWLQLRQQRRATDAIELLFSLTPGTAHLVEDPAAGGPVRDVAVESLERGHVVEVRPGESFPVDGVLTHGSTMIEAAVLTGESRPVHVAAGDSVPAGAVNRSAAVRVRTDATGRDTRVGRMMATIERLSRERIPLLGSADRLAKPFVVVALALAALAAAVGLRQGVLEAVNAAMALLIVTCPCALALATPLASTVGIGRCAAAGTLVKGGDVFERLGRPGVLILDKTGTVTTGRYELVRWTGDDDLRAVVAALEVGSNHPVAAVLASAADASPDVGGVVHHPARGVEGVWRGLPVRAGSPSWLDDARWSRPMRDAAASAAECGLSPVAMAVGGEVRAVAALGDAPREDAGTAIASLRRAGWEVRLLSGDDPAVVRAVARHVGIEADLASGHASPEDKLATVRALRGDGRRVVMVGDGVNDAAALARADVGVAVHGGAEASLAAADVYLDRPGLMPLLDLMERSGSTLRTIRRCIAVALSYNVVAASLAVAGLIGPLLAAVLMPISSATVVAMASSAGRRRGSAVPAGRGV